MQEIKDFICLSFCRRFDELLNVFFYHLLYILRRFFLILCRYRRLFWFFLIFYDFEDCRSDKFYLGVSYFSIFPKKASRIRRALLKQVFINNTEFDSFVQMSQVDVFMHRNCGLIKSIFFQMKEINRGFTFSRQCWFNWYRFDSIWIVQICFIDKRLEPLFTFGVELNIIIQLLIEGRWHHFNETFVILLTLLLNELVCLYVISHYSLLLVCCVICLLLLCVFIVL